MLKNKNKEKNKNENILDWNYHVKEIDNHKTKLDDMSLIQGLYEDFIVTKTGNLVGIIDISGINLDLLSENEQENAFNCYNAFLMAGLGTNNKTYQFKEVTVPVDLNIYIKGIKKRFLTETNEYKKNLIASYIAYFEDIQNQKYMTTKKHLLILNKKIKNKSFKELESASYELYEDIHQTIKELEEAMTDYDLEAHIMENNDVLKLLKILINFNG